jgi:hypothetical protein
MDTEIIKWMCDKAEGFKSIGMRVLVPAGQQIRIDNLLLHKGYYPLLLQRAIEGVNREGTANIEQLTEQIEVIYGMEVPSFGFGNATEDQAKESALKYIYEQEKK